MKAKTITKIVAIALAGSIFFQSCIGSFRLTNTYWEWNNRATDIPILNAVIFFVIGGPVTGITLFVDAVILNTIEFWTGSNPMAYNTKEVINENGERLLVETTPRGHKITNLETNEVVSFLFNADENSWALETEDGVQPLFTHIDAENVKMYNGVEVQLSEAGLQAFKAVTSENQRNLAVK
ncbi:MAG: DUF3332 domain-containing protein [Bacteroidales bacterium]|nr:DUF3332 domain-containing protein [Bacteroidales bacterium]